MSTYLALCQAVALESGTVPSSGSPASVLSQTGRLLRIVGWVADAWKEIQTERLDWRWMRAEFSGNTISGTTRYDAAALGISSRFGEWRYEGPGRNNSVSLYKTADGVADEGFLQFKEWETFRHDYLIGTQLSGKPSVFSIDPSDKLCFYPTPDADYTIRGQYQKAPQILTADTDEPEFQSQFHDLIKWNALVYMGVFDEATTQSPSWALYAQRIRDKLEKRELPRIKLGGPLA